MTYHLIKKLDDEDIQNILSVYKHPLVSRFISIDEDSYWRYITSTDNVYFYTIYMDDILVAAIHLELVQLVLYMSVVVDPQYQQQGIATTILKDIQTGKLELNFNKIRVSIDKNNIYSLKLFENVGFICVGNDEELLEYEYSKS